MLKYVNSEVTLREIPDEITLCINISNCPCHCKGCHSSYLAEDIGNELDDKELINLINSNQGITCVAFMGGDNDPLSVYKLCKVIQFMFPDLKKAWYSGKSDLPEYLQGDRLSRFDYIKLGPYMEEFGGLDNRNTNQRLYEVVLEADELTGIGYILEDITYKFWKNA